MTKTFVPIQAPPLSAPPGRFTRRRGTASVIAMLYLVLFSILSLGFYAGFTLTTQSVYNEKDSAKALAAAESGMEFLRYQLWALDIAHDTPPDELFDRVYEQLSVEMNGSANLGGGSIAQIGNAILIPGDPDEFISIDGGDAAFRGQIYQDGKELIVTTVGKTGTTYSLARAIRLRYGIFERPSAIFDYGVASKSAIEMIGNTAILGSPDPSAGSVLSTASRDYPLTMGSNCEISGEVSFSNPDAWVSAGSNSVINNEVGEGNWSDNVHHVDEPDFPVVDTSDYLPYATTTLSSSKATNGSYTNIRIPANTNPTFNAGTELNGVIYIEAPNKVKFAGHAKVTGIIVTENDPAGDLTSNLIEFRGTVTGRGVEELPTDDPNFAGLHELGGAFILANNFSVDFGGNADAGATGVAGTILASAISFSGTADAVVDGSVINMADSIVSFAGNSSVTIRSRGTSQQPHGLYFGSRYVPLPGSYEEVTPEEVMP